MKRLILMRHAKSSWNHPGLDDHARPLNGRGRRSAKAIGLWLAQNDYVPDQVLSSDSQRTRETWALVADAFAAPVSPDWRAALYLPSPARLLSEVQGATGDTVMLLAHNPGSAMFAEQIVAQAPEHPRFCDYPTAATLIADIDIARWSDLAWGLARPVDFIVPRDLLDGPPG